MTIAAPGPSPIDDSLTVARSNRISELARILLGLSPERFVGGPNRQYDEVEPPNLVAALRACGYYVIPRCVYTKNHLKSVQLEGNDGNNYFVEFSIRDPSIQVHAARIILSSLSLDPGPHPGTGPGFSMREIDFEDVIEVLPDYSTRINLGRVTADRAFLIGMSLLIGFMDDEADDLGEDARLAPLLALTMPTADELREIRAKLPPSTVNYDEEGDQPY